MVVLAGSYGYSFQKKYFDGTVVTVGFLLCLKGMHPWSMIILFSQNFSEQGGHQNSYLKWKNWNHGAVASIEPELSGMYL